MTVYPLSFAMKIHYNFSSFREGEDLNKSRKKQKNYLNKNIENSDMIFCLNFKKYCLLFVQLVKLVVTLPYELKTVSNFELHGCQQCLFLYIIIFV